MTTPTLANMKMTVEEIMTALRASTVQVNGERRNVTSHFVLAELPDQGRELNRKVVVKVTTYHNRDRKRYGTSIQQVETSNDGGFTTEKFGLYSGVSLAVAPVARHSATAMLAAHELGLAVLDEALHTAHPDVIKQFRIKEA